MWRPSRPPSMITDEQNQSNNLCALCHNMTGSLGVGQQASPSSNRISTPLALGYTFEGLKSSAIRGCSLCQLLLDNIPERVLNCVKPVGSFELEVGLWLSQYRKADDRPMYKGQLFVSTSPLWYSIGLALSAESEHRTSLPGRLD